MAELTLPEIFADNMVLQRGMPVPVWGRAEPGDTITVEFRGQNKQAVAGEDGTWRVELDPMPAATTPAPLVVRGPGAQPANRQVRNVVVGEVWLFSGQSNAAMAVGGSEGAEQASAEGDLPGIRFYENGGWTAASPQTVGSYSAFAFFFARALHRDEQVPVGMLTFARGGTMIQSWTTREGLANHPVLKHDVLESWTTGITAENLERIAGDKWRSALKESNGDVAAAIDKLVNRLSCQPAINVETSGMLAVAPFALRGFGWYQGESNAWGFPIAQRYHEELALLIRDWRRLWGGTDKPFLVVQLPHYPQDQVPTPPSEMAPWNVVMEAQWRIQSALTGVYTAVAIDLGKKDDIHPTRKAPVGERLALLARAKVYGRDVVCQGPVFTTARVEGRAVRLEFAPGHGGLAARGGSLKGFTIAGEDRHFVWADAGIEGGQVVCSSPAVPKPAAVRYAMTEHTDFTLCNEADLPASTFRTDDWPVDTPARTQRAAVAVRAAQPPSIDGQLDDAAWKAAAPAEGLTLFHCYRPAVAQTLARFSWDSTCLYALLVCRQDMTAVKADAATPNDSALWSDDNVQLFLDVNRDRLTYFRLAVNPAGVIAAGQGFNDWRTEGRPVLQNLLTCYRDDRNDWKSEARVATSRTPEAWIAEIAIPWNALGLPEGSKPGAVMGLQLARTHAANDERSEWATTGRDYNTGAMMPYKHMQGQILHHGVGRFGELSLR